MRIGKIGRFCSKLRAFENREKLPKMIELRKFGKNRSFLVIFRDFQMQVTLSGTDRFFLFSSQIKALLFCYSRFYFSSIFPMLNFHKKNEM